jgi:hypothetical protein
MKRQYNYQTLSEAVNELQKRGYTHDFLVRENNPNLYLDSKSIELSPKEFQIDEIYRFEGMTDPADASIVFAISSKHHHIKGIGVNGFGAEFGYRSFKVVEDLRRRGR